MQKKNPDNDPFEQTAGIDKYKRVIFKELVARTHWFIKIRWFAPLLILLIVFTVYPAGFDIPAISFLMVALFIGIYNLCFFLISRKKQGALKGNKDYIIKFDCCQFIMDFITLFILIHLTGGMTSVLIFLFIFHIIFASTLFSPVSGYLLAIFAVTGMAAIHIKDYIGWFNSHPVVFSDKIISPELSPLQSLLVLIFFAVSLFFTVFFASAFVSNIRKRVYMLADLTEAEQRLNKRLNALYTMTEAIGSVKNLTMLLNMVTSELCDVMDVLGISVKLLSNDGKFLQYVAANGLVADVLKRKVIEVEKSPLNREIINGKPYVTGRVKPGEMMFQFGEDLAAVDIQSVLFVPLVVENKVIGIAGAYCKTEERFSTEEVDFFRQAAGLVAIAIENARGYEAIEKLMDERNRFMMRVAHNLRAPLAAMISMLDVVRGEYDGPLTDKQKDHLGRIERRARNMIRLINELLILANNRGEESRRAFLPLDMKNIANRIRNTFQDEARQKGLVLEVISADKLPSVKGNPDMIEQAIENLVSNAIKYTAREGNVRVEFFEGPGKSLLINVKDTGIGIDEKDREKLFQEFFRATNAIAMEEVGTGLGLAIVKQTVDQHGGRVIVESTPGQGSLFVISLPSCRKEPGE